MEETNFWCFSEVFTKKCLNYWERQEIWMSWEKKLKKIVSEGRELWWGLGLIVIATSCVDFMWRAITLNEGLESVIAWVNTKKIPEFLKYFAMLRARQKPLKESIQSLFGNYFNYFSKTLSLTPTEIKKWLYMQILTLSGIFSGTLSLSWICTTTRSNTKRYDEKFLLCVPFVPHHQLSAYRKIAQHTSNLFLFWIPG